MAPTLLLITLTLTPSTSIFSKLFLTASAEPFTSALIITLISFKPSFILSNNSSKLTDLLALLFLSFSVLLFEIYAYILHILDNRSLYFCYLLLLPTRVHYYTSTRLFHDYLPKNALALNRHFVCNSIH